MLEGDRGEEDLGNEECIAFQPRVKEMTTYVDIGRVNTSGKEHTYKA